jgi:hypothetical protein
MPTTKTGYWIRVENDQVKDVWDYRPTTGPKADLPGWREAVEVFPDLTDGREIITTHSFDLTVTPAQINWAKRDLTVDERKGALKAEAKRTFQEVVDAELAKELDDDPATTYDAAAVTAAQTTYQAAVTAIDALTTHEDVDSYGS